MYAGRNRSSLLFTSVDAVLEVVGGGAAAAVDADVEEVKIFSSFVGDFFFRRLAAFLSDVDLTCSASTLKADPSVAVGPATERSLDDLLVSSTAIVDDATDGRECNGL